MKNVVLKALAALVLTAIPLPALAYIGPGAGASVIGSVLAVFAAIAVVIFSILWYPIRRLRKRRAAKLEQAKSSGTPDAKTNQED